MMSPIGTSFTLHLLMMNFHYIDDKKIIDNVIRCSSIRISATTLFYSQEWSVRTSPPRTRGQELKIKTLTILHERCFIIKPSTAQSVIYISKQTDASLCYKLRFFYLASLFPPSTQRRPLFCFVFDLKFSKERIEVNSVVFIDDLPLNAAASLPRTHLAFPFCQGSFSFLSLREGASILRSHNSRGG